MTSKQEIVAPVVANPLADGFVNLRVATEEALEVLSLKPIPTTWKSDSGRPIYYRLNSISQQYQRGYDFDQAFVYLDPKFGKPYGAGSLQVGRFTDRNEVLFVESGEITWEKGQIEVPSFEVDTSTLNFGLGLIDGLGSTGYVARDVVGAEEIVDFTPKPSPFENLVGRLGVYAGKGFATAMGINGSLMELK